MFSKKKKNDLEVNSCVLLLRCEFEYRKHLVRSPREFRDTELISTRTAKGRRQFYSVSTFFRFFLNRKTIAAQLCTGLDSLPHFQTTEKKRNKKENKAMEAKYIKRKISL